VDLVYQVETVQLAIQPGESVAARVATTAQDPPPSPPSVGTMLQSTSFVIPRDAGVAQRQSN
jgi:hypothetical protein